MSNFAKASAAYEHETDRLWDELTEPDKPDSHDNVAEPEQKQPCNYAADRAAREYADRFYRDPRE